MRENKKYQLLEDDTIVRDGRTLYRIQALRDVRFRVEKDAVGGYVEKEANLSQEGPCWLFDEACAYEDARVEGTAALYDEATLRGKAKLFEEARVLDQVIVQGEAKVGGRSRLKDQVVVGGKAVVKGMVRLYGFVHVGGSAYLEGEEKEVPLEILGTTMIHGDTIIQGYGLFSEEDAIFETGSFQIEEDA